MGWKTAFGEGYAVPTEIDALVAAGRLEDASWKNDVCPSFSIDGGVRLWVDHPDPTWRENGGKRFAVTLYERDGTYLDTPLATDRLSEVLAYLADHWDVKL